MISLSQNCCVRKFCNILSRFGVHELCERNLLSLSYTSVWLDVLLIGKDIIYTFHLKSNITSRELLIIFSVTILFFLVWFKQIFFSSFLDVLDFFVPWVKKFFDLFNDIRTCTRSIFFAYEFMFIYDNSLTSDTQMSSTFSSVSKLKYSNLNYFF